MAPNSVFVNLSDSDSHLLILGSAKLWQAAIRPEVDPGNARSCRWSRVWVASCRYGVRRQRWMPADVAAPAAGTAAAVGPATVIARAAGRGQPGPRRPRPGSWSG
jgi:hypothetical protein